MAVLILDLWLSARGFHAYAAAEIYLGGPTRVGFPH